MELDSSDPAVLLPRIKTSPLVIPEHQLIRCIGRGSYGQVWLARNAMGLYRAVKIVFRNSFESQRPFERELSGIRKFEPVSRLHEGFIDLLQVGINEGEGYFYYIIELGDDESSGQIIDPEKYCPHTLAREISRRGKLSLEKCLQLGVRLTEALSELHKHGLVHRDIKPSNIIFVGGAAKLADIGLVADVNAARSYVGTEGFIPPEGPGTPQADIYSLGKVLYEASTGKDRNDFPELPTQWSESIEYEGFLELNEVILKSCKQDPAKRYTSAWDMHADLLVVLNGKSVKRLRMFERRWANVKRIAAAGGIALATVAVLTYQLYREWRIAAGTRQRQVTSNVIFGNRAMESGDLLRALPYFAEAWQLDRGNQNHDFTHRLRIGSVLSQCPKLAQMIFAQGQVDEGVFSPDGRSILIAQHFGSAEIYDLQSGRLYRHAFGPKYGLRSATYSPDSRFILTTSESQTAIIWDAISLSKVLDLPHKTKVYSGRFSPDSLRVATACGDGKVRIWSTRTGQLELAIAAHAGPVMFAEFSHNGRWIVSASQDETARIWHADNGHPLTAPLQHHRWVNQASFSPDDKKLITGADDHKARVWDVETGHRIWPDLLHNDIVKSVEFSPDGRLILTSSLDGTARLWDAQNLGPLGSNPILRHRERVMHASFSPDVRLIISTCVDGSVRIWDLAGAAVPPARRHRLYSRDGCWFLAVENGTLQLCDASNDRAAAPPFHPAGQVESTRLTRNGLFALTVSLLSAERQTNRLIQVWNCEKAQLIGPDITNHGGFNNPVLRDDGKGVLTYAGTKALLWDTLTGTAMATELSHTAPINSAVFSPQGDLVLTIAETNVCVWQTATGRAAYSPVAYEVPITYADFSADGRYFVTCCADTGFTKCFAQIWNARTGKPVGDRLPHEDGVLFASFSRDANRIATTSEDFTAKVWETSRSQLIGLPLTHSEQVTAAAFNSDGKWVATASADRTARIWDPENNDPLTPPLQHLVALTDVKILPGDRRLVTADEQGNAFVWELPLEKRPVADISELAAFLSGRRFSPTTVKSSAHSESLKDTWQYLRAKHPESFSTSSDEVARWHEFQADDSESKDQWFAAVFHLERILSLHRGDQDIAERLAKARNHLKPGK